MSSRTFLVWILALGLLSAFGVPARSSEKVYFTDTSSHKVQRADLADGIVQDLITTGVFSPVGIDLDLSGGMMYWVDNSSSKKAQRASLNGSDAEDILTGVYYYDIALDEVGGKLYVTALFNGKIQRANLDGSGLEDLITGLVAPFGIAVDESGGKIYWTDAGAHKIQRADLDGSNVEDVIAGLISPYGIALDLSAGKVYWTDPGTHKIHRCNMDGTGTEDLVTGLSEPYAVALDVAGGMMYWTDRSAGKIQRANLDGTDVEDLADLDAPSGITVTSGMTWCQDSAECDPNQYCTKLTGDCNGDGFCTDRPEEPCDPVYNPVCGCDEITYYNKCEAALAGVSMECRAPCTECLTICDSNGDCGPGEYCAKAAGDCEGEGRCAELPNLCLYVGDAACGCNDVTYDNACYAAGAGTNVDYPGECSAEPMPGDCDGDDDVDLQDFLHFQTCFTGPGGGPLGPECECVDFDDDDDVDLLDFLAFQTAHTGPG